MDTWEDIRAWRRATRAELLARRLRLPRGEKDRIRAAASEFIWAQFPELRRACIGFYWPFKGEIDLRHLVRDFLAVGAQAALPVVVEKRRPLEFWAWRPRMKLERGMWNIPIPAERNPLRPTVLLVPLLGFDAAGYRLGYGGGYYDRTLASMNPAPLTIGVGDEGGRLETIDPQPHDVPLDAIVTEAGCARFRYRGDPLDRAAPDAPEDADDEGAYASPPCFMHEIGPTYLG
jgi:5-formyltetrahydrofolate cyclo-ligase